MKRLTHKEYEDKLFNIEADLFPIEEYVNMREKIKHICTKDHVSLVAPRDIVNNKIGCPVCAGRRSPKEYNKLLENTGLILIDEYTGSQKALNHFCTKCENVWKVRPAEITSTKRTCPHCKTMTTTKYQNTLVEKRITVLSEFTTQNHKVLHKCNDCSHEWQAFPSNILSGGTGCPKCNTFGPNLERPGRLYYIKINSKHYKIGITSKTIKQRFASDWKNNLIETILDYPVTKLQTAYDIEQSILLKYEDYKLNKDILISGGNTEIFKQDITKIDLDFNIETLYNELTKREGL